MSLKIKKKETKGYYILRIIGELVTEEVHKLSRALDELHSKNCNKIGIDLSEADSVDSSALGVLILNFKILKKKDGDLCIINPSSYVKEILASSNLDTVFRIIDSEDNL